MPVPNGAQVILGVLCLSAALAAGCALGGEEPPAETGAPMSPRLALLAKEAHEGIRGAAGRFWEEIGKRGTPLVEPAPADAEPRARHLPLARRPQDPGGVPAGQPLRGGPADPARGHGRLVPELSRAQGCPVHLPARALPRLCSKDPGKIRETAGIDRSIRGATRRPVRRCCRSPRCRTRRRRAVDRSQAGDSHRDGEGGGDPELDPERPPARGRL